MYNDLYSKALGSSISRQEFIELVPTLDDTISLVRVVRRRFELGLHDSKLLAESILAGDLDPGVAYDQYSKGILSNPTESEFITACKELQARMEFGTLFRVLQRWSSIQSMPADFQEVLTWDFKGIFIPNDKHTLRYRPYDHQSITKGVCSSLT